MRTAIFRWKAIVPLALFLVLLVATWSLWGDLWLRAGIQAGGTAALGARVELKRAHLGLKRLRLNFRPGLTRVFCLSAFSRRRE